MSRYYGEEKLNFGTHRVLNARSKTERLLKHELWRGQQRGGVGSPVHSRQIGSRFSLVPSAPFDAGGQAQVQKQPAGAGSSKATNHPASSSETASNGTDIALFVRCHTPLPKLQHSFTDDPRCLTYTGRLKSAYLECPK